MTGLIAAVVGVPLLAIVVSRLSPQARVALGLLRQSLGRKRRPTNLARAAEYHVRLSAQEKAGALDSRSWDDLDLDDVFLSLDRTESEPGSQYLYHRLRTPAHTREPLDRLERSIAAVTRNAATLRDVRTALHGLDDPRAGQLVNLLFGALPPRPPGWWLFPLLTAASIACLVGIPFRPRALIVWLGICVVNLILQIYNRDRVKAFVPALHEVPALVRVARRLAELLPPELAEEKQLLQQGANRLVFTRRAALWLMFEPGQADPLIASLYEYVNMLFLFDVNAFVFAIESLRASRDSTRRMFDVIGYVDMTQSIAAWRDSLPVWSRPEFTDAAKSLHVVEVTHPLVPTPVANSLDVTGASVLITGSNMSGKTTFIRTMGVNSVLAQSLNTVCAAEWRTPLLTVRTSIGRSDSLQEGKSYYLAEVEAVHALINAKETGAQHLFLLDEIFRGTNTAERVAAGYAVLAYLNRGLDLVFVASHDLEVIELLGDAFVSHHFREAVGPDGLTFDFLLRPGRSSTRNAIALLQIMDYPADVIADALSAVSRPDLLSRGMP